jgi:ferrochelatase
MTMPPQRVAVLLLAYGSPDRLADVPAYLADIRGGRPVSDEAVAELTERYRRVGVPTPLLRLTRNVAAALEGELAGASPARVRGYVGMKHWRPRIAEAVAQIAADGADLLIALPMAPHFSAISIGGYRRQVESALRSVTPAPTLDFIETWHDHPPYSDLIAGNVRRALEQFERPDQVVTIFTAHSLPARILAEGDPYRDQLLETARLVAERVPSLRWQFAFQSASASGEPWLGPDLLEALDTLAAERVEGVIVAPIGFVADHLEILYDIDVEAQERAHHLGLQLVRTDLPNDDPAFVGALARLVAPCLAPARAARNM